MELRYQDTKLMNILTTRALASHLSPTSPVIATAVCPGFTKSELLRHAPDPNQFAHLMPVARTTEEGARQLIYAAIAGEKEGEVQVESFKGAFIQHIAVASPSPWVTSEEGGKVQEILWNETLDTFGLFLRRFRKLWMSIFRSEIVVINRVLSEVIYVS